MLKTYNGVAEYGVAGAITAATYQSAALYQDFGKAMLASQRPKGLKKAELEQYNVMLEEQAFPSRRRRSKLHEGNAKARHGPVRRVGQEELRRAGDAEAGARWGKVERAQPGQALNQKGIELRWPASSPRRRPPTRKPSPPTRAPPRPSSTWRS